MPILPLPLNADLNSPELTDILDELFASCEKSVGSVYFRLNNDHFVKILAYKLWEIYGCPEGHDLDFYYIAENIISTMFWRIQLFICPEYTDSIVTKYRELITVPFEDGKESISESYEILKLTNWFEASFPFLTDKEYMDKFYPISENPPTTVTTES